MTLPLLPSATPIKSIKYSPTTTAARENVFKATFMEDICFFTPSHSYFEWYFGPFSNKITTKGKSNSQNHFQNLKEYIRRDKLFRSFLKHSYPSVPMQKVFKCHFSKQIFAQDCFCVKTFSRLFCRLLNGPIQALQWAQFHWLASFRWERKNHFGEVPWIWHETFHKDPTIFVYPC